jgi:hypothetical protein
MNANADGQPQEILIMDTDDINTAVHVIRMNRNGIGFSNNGYEGPFESAWTIDGQFNADFIATGTLLASFIKGGTLLLGGANNGNGILELQDENGNTNATLDRRGLRMLSGSILLQNILVGKYYYSYIGATGIQSYRGTEGTTSLNAESSLSISGGAITLSGTDYTGVQSGATQRGFNITDTRNGEYVVYSMQAGYNSPSVGHFQIVRHADGNILGTPTFGLTADISSGKVAVWGDLNVYNGTKSRVANADEYGLRSLYCYETPSPMFGDVGEGVIDETGFCYVFLDPVFAETISTLNYQVFLQKYGRGDCFVCERKPDYFVVQGEPGLAFGWELKAKQKDFSQLRLEREQLELDEDINYGEEGIKYYISLEEGRIA